MCMHNMYIHVCACVGECVRVSVIAYMHVCICACMYVYAACIYLCAYVCIYICINIYLLLLILYNNN